MNVFVVGANGQIGQHVVDLLKNSNEHHVRAMVRKPEQAETLKNKGVEAVLADLEDPVSKLVEAAKGSDAIIFTAGSGGKTGPDKTLLIDLDGAVKMVEVAEQLGIDRFVMVSAFQANHREHWNEAIKSYYVAKHYADRALLASSLNYTIVRPGGLLNEPGTGKIKVAENLSEGGSVPREDVAKVVVGSLEEPSAYHSSFDLISGDVPIDEALKSI